MSLSDWAETQILTHLYAGSGAMAKPAGRYLALYTTPTTGAGGGLEVNGGGYARQSIALTVSGIAPAQATNAATFDFPAATAAWGTLTHFAIHDSLTGGNRLHFGPLATAKTIGTGDVFRVNANSLVLAVAQP